MLDGTLTVVFVPWDSQLPCVQSIVKLYLVFSIGDCDHLSRASAEYMLDGTSEGLKIASGLMVGGVECYCVCFA